MKAIISLCSALLLIGTAWAQAPTCPTGMVYKSCGSGCPASCTVPDPLCLTVCIPGCYCPTGEVLNGPNQCVTPADCPSATSTPTPISTATIPTATGSTPPACAAGKVYDTCGSYCPITCQNKANPPEICPQVCVQDCFCAAGTILNTADGSCVADANCPASPPACAAGKSYQTCGSACPVTCQNKDGPPVPCTSNCVQDCFCAADTILNTADGSCVAEDNCPASTTSTPVSTPSISPPPVFELAYGCPEAVGFGVCVIEQNCSSTGSQDCGSPSRLCCLNGCGGQVCSEGVLPTPLCTAVREKALNKSMGLLGALVPQCDEDGSFSSIQCYEGSCWCVDTTTGVSTSLLAAPGLFGSLPCAPTPTTVTATATASSTNNCSLAPDSGLCEAYMPHMFFNSTSKQCERFVYGGCGGNANRFTTYISCMEGCAGVEVPFSALNAKLSQTLFCPTSAVVGACASLHACSADSNCTTGQKCCSNECGQVCVDAISAPFYTSPQACPAPAFPICDLFGCSHDACGDSSLCCPTGCGSICMTALTPTHRCPEVAAHAWGLIGSYIPQCEVDGSFTAYQCRGSYNQCWCVDTITGEALSIPTPPVQDANCSYITSKPVCVNGQKHSQCGSECPITCKNKDNPPVCPEVCVSGCFCPADMVLDGNTCVHPSACPHEPVCVNGQKHSQCGSECPITCENKDNPPVCPEVCVSGCFCPADMVLNGNTCVRPSSCPQNCAGIQCGWPNCLDGASPVTDDQHCCPFCAACSAGGLHMSEGQLYEDGCSTCLCRNGSITCNALICPIPIIRTVTVGMTYDGNYDSITDVDEFKRDVKNALVNTYSSSHSLEESQITGVEISRGSVIIHVVVTDNTDSTGANVTLLIIQMEQDYNKGVLVMPLNDGTMRPASSFVFSPHSAGQAGPAPFIFAVAGVVGFLVLAMIVIVIVGLVITAVLLKRTSRSHARLPTSPSTSSDKISGMKNPMFDLTEKA